MGSLSMDLTRHDGGDVVGARLPTAVDLRSDAAEALVDRAVARWALSSCRPAIRAAVHMMLEDQSDVEPLDLCFHISPVVLTISVGSHLVPVPLVAGGCVAAAA